MNAQKFTLPAFAKINLLLRVLGRRADGYHEIRTVFQTITLHDTLTFQPLESERLELVCSAPGIPVDENNLVLRAAILLREHCGIRRGARIELEKRIPAGGGLGGGSANAAVALLGLARLWATETKRGQLEGLGARLGADVPFFFTGGTALGTGTGTEIVPLEDVGAQSLIVVTPDVKVSTAEAYKALNAPSLTKDESVATLLISRAEAQISGSLCEVLSNDFEPVIFHLYPEVARARESLLRAGARCALLSGSGASVFGVFDSGEAVESARAALRRELNWQVFACRTLSGAEYRKTLSARAEPG